MLLTNNKNVFSLLWIDVYCYAANVFFKIDFVLPTNIETVFHFLCIDFISVLLLNYLTMIFMLSLKINILILCCLGICNITYHETSEN